MYPREGMLVSASPEIVISNSVCPEPQNSIQAQEGFQ